MVYNILNYLIFGLCPHLRTEIDPVSETLCSLVFFRIQDDG
jgi:hypothetical protein